MQELARGWKDEPEILAMLKSLVITGDNISIQITALQELARGWQNQPEIFIMLKKLAISSDKNYIQVTALQELVKGWKDKAEILEILKELAMLNDNRINKAVVVQELARGWKNDINILYILMACLEKENNSFLKDYLKDTLMQELIESWQPNSDIYDFIYNCATDNAFEPLPFIETDYNARKVALEAILKNYINHPQTLPLLRDRALNDPSQLVREFAAKKLKDLDA